VRVAIFLLQWGHIICTGLRPKSNVTGNSGCPVAAGAVGTEIAAKVDTGGADGTDTAVAIGIES